MAVTAALSPSSFPQSSTPAGEQKPGTAATAEYRLQEMGSRISQPLSSSRHAPKQPSSLADLPGPIPPWQVELVSDCQRPGQNLRLSLFFFNRKSSAVFWFTFCE
jgi:hypothetical protein